MKLTENEIAAAYYAVAGFVRHFNVARRQVPPEVARLYGRLDYYIRLSPSRHETTGCTDAMEDSGAWIGTTAVVQMLGKSGTAGRRWVERHADEIGAQRIGGRLFFRQSDVLDYAERLAAHG